MSVETKLMTAEELEAMPDDGKRYELFRGELRTMAPANLWPSIIAMRIGRHLATFVEQHGLGGYVTGADGGFVLASNPDTMFAPDVGYVSKGRAIPERGIFRGTPELAVEVVSPTDTYSEIEEKVVEYLATGTPVVIVVDRQRRSAFVRTRNSSRRLTLDDALTAPDVLPGWSLPLRELFAD